MQFCFKTMCIFNSILLKIHSTYRLEGAIKEFQGFKVTFFYTEIQGTYEQINFFLNQIVLHFLSSNLQQSCQNTPKILRLPPLISILPSATYVVPTKIMQEPGPSNPRIAYNECLQGNTILTVLNFRYILCSRAAKLFSFLYSFTFVLWPVHNSYIHRSKTFEIVLRYALVYNFLTNNLWKKLLIFFSDRVYVPGSFLNSIYFLKVNNLKYLTWQLRNNRRNSKNSQLRLKCVN